MKIEQFQMERMQSTWENVVEYNLSESGVHPLTLRELLSDDELHELLDIGLGYSQTNGTPQLREQIIRLYPGANLDQVLVTAGSSEANYLLIWSNIEPGDEVVFIMPNYMQMWGLVRGFGAVLKPFWLKEKLGWAPDLDELKDLVTARTKLIIVTNPNNPTGAVLSPEAMSAVVESAERVGAWIIADEVYQGAEREGPIAPSFWGKTDRAVIVNGLSKAYGLPGTRIGWIVGRQDFIQKTWPYHDYTTISPSILSDRIAQIALSPSNREKILERTRGILRRNYPLIESWLNKRPDLFSYVAPQAGAIAFARYHHEINSTELVTRLIREKSTLIVPGDHFEIDRYLRFGFGSEPECLRQGLARVEELFSELKKSGR
ncbi:MAG: aminotransferase class I/II-fold pyridoxal phosphate-dependent enzyme [Candidatus Aminicenantes bacterium]|nr:aminotransferase class I/II-fold pyridoxal phosphate-dependent enzyme [Candidatus Aminicenantes bacterium]